MATRINAALRKRLVGSALGGLIAFAAVPGAMAQWLPPWRAGIPAGEIAHQLEAQGYMLIAPLQRRAGVYLADVRAGPAGYQRLVIDARNGGIIERFISPPRGFSPEFAARDGDFGQPPPGVVHPPGYGFDGRTGGTAPRSAYGGPAEVHIPTAISPYGQSAPFAEAQAARRDRAQDAAFKRRAGGRPADDWAASAAPRSTRGDDSARTIGAASPQAGAQERIRSGREPKRLIGKLARDARSQAGSAED